MNKLTELLEEGETILLYHSGFTIKIEMSPEEGFTGDIYNSIIRIDDIEDTESFDGGSCDSSAEDAIDFFIDLVNTHIENKKDS